MLHHAPLPPSPVTTIVRFTLARRTTPPARAALARFRLAIERPSLAGAVASADVFLARGKDAARRAHLSFRMRDYETFRRRIYTPGGHAPPRTVYVTEARFDLRGPSARALAPLVGTLARRAYLVSFSNVPALGSQGRARIEKTLETRLLRAVRRTAVRDCRLLGDRGTTIHRVLLSRSRARPLPPHPIFMEALAARGARLPTPPASASHERFSLTASVSVWCSPSSPDPRHRSAP